MIGIGINLWIRSIFGGAFGGGPFLLQTDGTSRILLVNGTDRLLITGSDPASGSSGQPMGLLLALTYP